MSVSLLVKLGGAYFPYSAQILKLSSQVVKANQRVTPSTSLVIVPVLNAMLMMIMLSVTALFLVRLKAVYLNNAYVTAFFGACWLANLVIFAYGTITCITTYPPGYIYVSSAVYDTLMYFSISWRLSTFTAFDRWQDRLKSFFTGARLGKLSRALLQSGQLYYL